jgi:hypothetical protein
MLCLHGSVMFGAYNWATNPGNGTADNPYQISTAEQLASIGSNAGLLDDYFILTDDIDMSAYTFDNSPIAPDTNQDNNYTDENRFSGSLDGQGYRIRHLTITRSGTSYNIGLIGLTTGNWEVKNLGLENLNITVGNSSEYLGGLLARGYGGTISDCFVIGSITSGNSTKYMGGLTGLCSTGISNCRVMCALTNGTGSSSTGGAVGQLGTTFGWLEKCYSTGAVVSGSTSTTIGALVGFLVNNGAQVNDCYYRSTAGGYNTYGTSKTVAQLKQIATYTNWEFNGAQLGNQGQWRMRDDLDDYPYLAWEFIGGDFYGDFRVNMKDFAAFSQSWQTDLDSFDFNWLCDLNGNSFIDLDDFRAFCDDWLIGY